MIQLNQYSANVAVIPSGEQTAAPSAAVPPPADVVIESQIPVSEAVVTPQAQAPGSVLSREEKVEYRDQDGNLLNEEQVKSLEGKVSFSTRYETRTRVLDAAGNEIADGTPGAEGFAPPHPDVEREPETVSNASDSDGKDAPATVSPGKDLEKERSVNDTAKRGQPRPASEAREATK